MAKCLFQHFFFNLQIVLAKVVIATLHWSYRGLQCNTSDYELGLTWETLTGLMYNS